MSNLELFNKNNKLIEKLSINARAEYLDGNQIASHELEKEVELIKEINREINLELIFCNDCNWNEWHSDDNELICKKCGSEDVEIFIIDDLEV
jgi:hypothetical protein